MSTVPDDCPDVAVARDFAFPPGPRDGLVASGPTAAVVCRYESIDDWTVRRAAADAAELT